MSKLQVYIFLLLNVVLFQNFDLSEALVMPLNKVDIKSRISHARELLGKSYRGSGAEKAEHIKDLHITIYNKVKVLLPKKHKSHALAISEAIIRESRRHDFDPVFIMAVIKTESSFNPKALGTAGEIGLMQIKPNTAKNVAEEFDLKWKGSKTLENPVDNIRIGVAYFSLLRDQFSGYANKYLSAYNLGAARVKKLYKKDVKPNVYSRKVMKNYSDIYSVMVATRMPSLIEQRQN